MLLWTTKGRGIQRISYRDHEMLPGQVCFMQEAQVHQMLQYPEDGWMILFKPSLFRDYLRQHPQEDQAGLFDFFNRKPFVELD